MNTLKQIVARVLLGIFAITFVVAALSGIAVVIALAVACTLVWILVKLTDTEENIEQFFDEWMNK